MKYKTIKAILLALFLLSCEEKQDAAQKCDAVCELIRENLKADFERLTKMVTFGVDTKRKAYSCFWSGLITDVSVYKRPTGAVVLYKPWTTFLDLEFQEAELSEEEWQSFIKSLYMYLNKDFGGSYEMEEKYEKGSNITITRDFRAIYPHPDKRYPDVIHIWKTGPSDWDGVEKLMGGIVAKTRERAAKPFEENLRAEYQKRFGEPISDIELSMRRVTFAITSNRTRSCIQVSQTETGALADNSDEKAELSTGEWLDFVRALHKSDVSKLENKYGEPPAEGKWALEIYSSGKLYPIVTEGFGTYPPNWDGLKKTMEDMNAKIIEKSKKGKNVRGRK
ncbi:MAG: hypothetical protein LBC64_11420 [Fibromonadaceae bacterium]|jgi:enamine deaminase RidA (YjgF/YER057c/UK114 family)|nr:hypothetical protein [Fibromonadaceae bacterium]